MYNVFNQRSRTLLGAMLATDFKIRYQGSVLGYMWSLIRPLSLFVVLYIVFAKFFKVGGDVPYFGVYLLLGIMIWNFFAEATGNALSSLVDRGDLIRKVKVPRYTIVFTAVFSAAINLAINLGVVTLIALVTGADPSLWALVAIPLLILELIVLAVAMGFGLSVLYVKYRDVKYIWELILQVAFYATPIIYPLSRIPEKYHQILVLNPMAQIIQDMRHVLITDKTLTSWQILGTWKALIGPLVIILIAVVSYYYFKRNIGQIAEEL